MANGDLITGLGAGGMELAGNLTLTSTTLGLVLPRLTTIQRDAITPNVPGMLIYNTTTGKLNVRAAIAWEAVTSV